MYVDADVNEMLMVVAFRLRRCVSKCSGSSGASVKTSTDVSEFRTATGHVPPHMRCVCISRGDRGKANQTSGVPLPLL